MISYQKFSVAALGLALGLVGGQALIAPLMRSNASDPVTSTAAFAPTHLVARAEAADDDARAARLDALFAQLESAGTLADAIPAEKEIWSLWLKTGRSDIDEQMDNIVAEMGLRRFAQALKVCDALVQNAPDYSEAWNKRATVHYILGNYDASLADIDRTLALEPRHFGALTGIALIKLRQGENGAAVIALKRALAVYPLLPSASEILLHAGQGVTQDPT